MNETEETVLEGTAGETAVSAADHEACEPATGQAPEEPVDALPAIIKCLKANHANTLALLDCLRACDVAPEDARPYREVETELLDAPSMDLTMQTPHTLIGMLVKAGGIKSVPVEEPADDKGCADVDGEAPDAAQTDDLADVAVTGEGAPDTDEPAEDGDTPVEQPADQPVDYVLYTTDAGREALAQFDPKSRFDELLGGEPETYLELYARVLDICSEDGGATRAQIEQDLKDHPALRNPKRIYPEYFISKLETIGGLSWDGAWRTTEAGARILESLA